MWPRALNCARSNHRTSLDGAGEAFALGSAFQSRVLPQQADGEPPYGGEVKGSLLGGMPATRLTSMSLQNTTNCPGARIVPSQTKVLLLARKS